MSWQPAYGGAVLALRDDAGRIVVTIDGPHPSGWALTIPPSSHCAMFVDVEEAKRVGEAAAPYGQR